MAHASFGWRGRIRERDRPVYRQAPPFCIQVESTEGCNLRCAFCGLNGIRPKHNVREDDRYLTPDLAELIALRIWEAGWTPRIEFAMHGEPTLNPFLPDIFARFRRVLPAHQLMLTTNGVPLQQHADGFDSAVDRLFAAGLNVLTLDNYRGLRVAPLARAYAAKRSIPQYEYPENTDGNPHKRRPVGTRIITVVRDISESSAGTHAHLSNHSGSAAPTNERAQGRRCALPFRELSIRWDGHIALCCNDWTGEFKLGSVKTMTLEQIWHHPALYAMRKYLIRGERTYRPCKGCDHLSYRPGLLPDPLGKEAADYPPPYIHDDAEVALALEGDPYTAPVLRPWELRGTLRRGLPVIQPN